MNIGEAVEALRSGKRVTRRGWNGKGMWLALVPGGPHVLPGTKQVVDAMPYVVMRTVQGSYVPWLCSQTDLLVTDWEVVE